MVVLGVAGIVATCFMRGIRDGAAFLIGAAISFISFWGWRRVVDALGPHAKRRASSFFVLRLIALVVLAWVIIKFLGLNVAVGAVGLLVSGAAVILEIIFELLLAKPELIYAS